MRERTKKRYRKYWNNLKDVKWHILFRFLLLMIMSAFFSTIAMLLESSGIISNARESVLYELLIICLCFLILAIGFMRRDYYILAHRRKYRMVSYISHGVFALVNLVMGVFFPYSNIYEFTFHITKLAVYTTCEVSPAVSVLVFQVILLVAIHYAPAGLKWILLQHG